MNPLVRFLLYNLLPSVLAGVATWLLLGLGLALLRVRSARLRLPLLYLPLVKSSLVLLGVGPALPWPEVFARWQAQALPPGTVLPWFLVWAGPAVLAQEGLERWVRRRVLAAARPAERADPRLARVLAEVVPRLQRLRGVGGNGPVCCMPEAVPRAEVLVADGIRSPFLLAGLSPPKAVLPQGLLAELEEKELAGILGHELAHLAVRRPWWCDAGLPEALTPALPVGALLGEQLRREEEKACDEVAAEVVGEVEAYAAGLLKAYRFQQRRMGPLARGLRYLPQLLGSRPLLTERVEHLLERGAAGGSPWAQRCAACLLGFLSLYLLF